MPPMNSSPCSPVATGFMSGPRTYSEVWAMAVPIGIDSAPAGRSRGIEYVVAKVVVSVGP